MLTKSKWLVSVISGSLAAVALAAAGPGYHVVKTYKVGGDGEKQTIFRSIDIVENKGPGASVPSPSADITGMFTRT